MEGRRRCRRQRGREYGRGAFRRLTDDQCPQLASVELWPRRGPQRRRRTANRFSAPSSVMSWATGSPTTGLRRIPSTASLREGPRLCQEPVGRETSQESTLPETLAWGVRPSWMTPESSLNRVEICRQLTPSQKTVVLEFLGCVEKRTVFGKSIGWHHGDPCLLRAE